MHVYVLFVALKKFVCITHLDESNLFMSSLYILHSHSFTPLAFILPSSSMFSSHGRSHAGPRLALGPLLTVIVFHRAPPDGFPKNDQKTPHIR